MDTIRIRRDRTARVALGPPHEGEVVHTRGGREIGRHRAPQALWPGGGEGCIAIHYSLWQDVRPGDVLILEHGAERYRLEGV